MQRVSLRCADAQVAELQRVSLRCADAQVAELQRVSLRCADAQVAEPQRVSLRCADAQVAELRLDDGTDARSGSGVPLVRAQCGDRLALSLPFLFFSCPR